MWINNAGYGRVVPIVDGDADEWARMIDVNFWGVVHGSRVAIEAMRAGGGARINIASLAGLMHRRGWQPRRARITLLIAVACLAPLGALVGLSPTAAMAIALTCLIAFLTQCWATNTSALTTDTFAPADTGTVAGMIGTAGSLGGVLLVFTTSGNSPNVLRALEAARKRGVKTIALLGRGGGAARGQADIELIVAYNETARIQEAHQFLLHAIMDIIEAVEL